MIDKEKIYDEEIYPLIEKIVDICNKHDISLFASFQYSDDGFCNTCVSKDGHNIFHYYDAIRQCVQDSSINIDKFIIWAMKRAKKAGHSSIILDQLGILTSPEGD